MAQSLRRPLSSVVGLTSSLQRRPFHHVPPHWGGPRQQGPVALRQRQSVGKSVKTMYKEEAARQMARQELSDMGMLPETFVNPQRTPVQAWKSPRKYLRFHWLKSWYKLRDRGMNLIFKLASPYGTRWYKRAFLISRSSIVPEAVRLHASMYSAFAEGRASELREICCDGIFADFQRRITQRKKGEKVGWKLLKMSRSPRVVSDRIARIPKEGSAVRQAVVRIVSRQQVTEGGSMKERDVTEYLVVQQRIEKWKPLKWTVWGTTKETTLGAAESWGKGD